MSRTTNVNIRLDAELKRQAETLFAALGLNMATAFNIFVRQAIQHNGLPFEVRLNKNPNAETIAAMLESEQIIHNPNIKGFNSVEELFKDLEA